MFSMPALLSDSGNTMSTFRQHETMLQVEHTLDWYFQSAVFNGLYNFNYNFLKNVKKPKIVYSLISYNNTIANHSPWDL